MSEIDWSKAPAWAQAFAKVIYGHPTLAEDYAWISADGYNVAPFSHCKNLCHPYKEDTFTLSMFRVVEFRPSAKPTITITNKIAMLEAALRSCVAVMDRDLSGLALIQPELKEAKQALEDMYLVDAEFEPWNGEGLPPVGIKCEFLDGNDWRRVFTVGIDDDGHMVVQTKNDGYRASRAPHTFRPIRTPEQIAAEEREKEVDDLCAEIVALYGEPKMAEHYHELAIALHAKGYRKQVQP